MSGLLKLTIWTSHSRKVNIWSGAIIISPSLGPLITAFIVDRLTYFNAFQETQVLPAYA